VRTKSEIIDILHKISPNNKIFALINHFMDNQNILTTSEPITSEEIDAMYAQWYSERDGDE
jgi:hypothetical protein